MYRYDEFDTTFVRQRVVQFREQVARRLDGHLTEEEFKPIRLMNGLYLQLHAYMLRVAIPYGTLSSVQMHKLADISTKYDKGYGHLTTRQNIQFNWPELKDVPDLLDELADVEMHAIQTSGNCIRNVTADHFAGVALNEVEDPRPIAELIRQWSSLHPEFTFLPRKFKIAVIGTRQDRAVMKSHDIGLRIIHNDHGEAGFEVHVGGGLGRTPIVSKLIRDFLPRHDLLNYLEAVIRVYNLIGRRDNKYKARIKILLHEAGATEVTRLVEQEFDQLKAQNEAISPAEIDRITAYFQDPAYEELDFSIDTFAALRKKHPQFDLWLKTSLSEHKHPGYAIVTVSLKPIGGIPGDITAEQMHAIADLAEKYSFSEIRVSHEQNLVLPFVRQQDLFELWQGLKHHNLATPNVGLASDIIACPGMDYCALATARSIPIAQDISNRFADLERQHEIGELKIKISGCINACGHHHVANIGILGLEKKGVEFYQITMGGNAGENTSIGSVIGRGFSGVEVIDAVETIVETYVHLRQENETFAAAYTRLGADPFKEALYVPA
jgi:sulfite reductase (NADPH) hemoprotein beta-component